MTRRHGRLKSALALLAGFAMIGSTAASIAPITMTEASWNDEVNVHASLKASEHLGVNYARAVAANGTLDRPSGLEPDIPGLQLNVNNLTGPFRLSPGQETYSTDGLLGAISFTSSSESCARVGAELCATPDTGGPPQHPAFAQARFRTMNVAALSIPGIDLNVGPIAIYESNSPIIARTSCSPNQLGTAFVEFGGHIELVRTGLTPNREVPIPGKNETKSESVTRLAKYTATVRNKQEYEIGYALAEVRFTLQATTILGNNEIWTLDIILARSECGLSKPLGSGVVPATAGRGLTMNAVMDAALATGQEDAESEHSQTATLDDALAEAELTETSELPATTAAAPNSEDETETDAEGTSTSPSTSSTSSTSSTVPEIVQQTVTATSDRLSTSNSATTSATTPRPSASSTRNTSVSAAPPSAPRTTQATAPTSAAPPIVIPDEPGTLASNARLEDVETITVGEEELDVVVVKGEEIPADAKQGARVLEIWLGGGNAGTAWETFASDDPDEDGWRWAAINQTTGAVVYIR